MAGFDQLLAGKGVNVADAMQQGYTIGNLANAAETGGLNLQILRNQLAMQQDPDYPKYIGALMNLATGGDQSQNGDAAQLAQSLFAKYPMQGSNAITQMMTLSKNAADIGKLRADTVEANTKAKSEQLQVLSNAAGGLASSEGPLMPDKVMTFLRQAQYVGAAPLMTDVVAAVKSGDEGAIRQSLMNFSQAGSNLAQRAAAGKDVGATALQKPQFDLDRYKTMVEAAKAIGGEVKQDANGQLFIVRPMAGIQLPSPPPPAGKPPGMTYSIAPDANMSPDELAAVQADAQKSGYTPAPGAPGYSGAPAPAAAAPAPNTGLPVASPVGVQGALSPAQEALKKTVMEPQLAEAAKGTAVAQRVLQLIAPLRNEMSQGFTGPLTNSEAGRNLLGTLTQLGMITPEQAQKYGAMRASDALSAELLGQISHQLNPRGSNMVLTMAQRAKTGPVDPQEAAIALLNALGTDARNTVAYGTALSDYVTKNPTDFGLTGWKPPKPSNAPPTGKFAAQLPAPSVANLGKIATDVDTGERYRSDGKSWVKVQ